MLRTTNAGESTSPLRDMHELFEIECHSCCIRACLRVE